MSSQNAPQIPIVDLRSQYQQIRSELHAALNEVIDTQQFILGPAVTRFEAQLAAYLKAEALVGVASGSDALLLALMTLDIGPGDAVLVTPFTFFSTVSAITRLGATPLFADIDAETYLLSTNCVADFLAERGTVENGQTIDVKTGWRLKALLPVHLFGRCCDLANLVPLAEKYSLKIVEDVAQACGARMTIAGQERFAGTIGDLGCFSFYPSKNLGGFGDGGAVCATNGDLAEKVRILRTHGENKRYHHVVTGINSRLDSMQAAVLSVKQRFLEQWCEQRIQRAQSYHRLFREIGLVREGFITIPSNPTNKSHIFNNYVVGAQRRDQLREFLGRRGIQSEIYYPLPLHLQPCFASLGYTKGEFPQAEFAANHVLAIPHYPGLTTAQQEFVVEQIREFYHR